MKTKPKTENDILYSTSNYDMFEFNAMNRSINKHKVNVLKAQMLACGGFRRGDAIDVYPKNANGKHVIKRGHHRFSAAMTLGIPFYYVVDDAPFDIIEDEKIRKDWTSTEISAGMANRGNPHYIRLQEFCKKNGLGVILGAMLLGGYKTQTGGITEVLRSGRFQCKPEGISHANKVIQILNVCVDCNLRFAKQRPFVQALSTLCCLKEFDTQKFIQRVRTDGAKITPRNQTMEYIEEIEALYNFRTKTYVPLKSAVIANGWYSKKYFC